MASSVVGGYRGVMSEARYDIEWDGERLVVEGTVPSGSGAAFANALLQAGRGVVVAWGSLEIDLLDLELQTGVTVAETVNAIRALTEWHNEIRLHSAPQMLAHTLYKAGLLEEGDIQLVDPREDEGTTAN